MTELTYLTDSYKKTQKATVQSVKIKGNTAHITLDKCIFYPVGGGQPSDKGIIRNSAGKAIVRHVRMKGTEPLLECKITGEIKKGDQVECEIDWENRYYNMRNHSAGHIVHEAVRSLVSGLKPLKGHHQKPSYIEYSGSITVDRLKLIEQKANGIVDQNLQIKTELVSFDELKNQIGEIPETLPGNKPLRLMTITGFDPVPDGGTQVANTGEVGEITIDKIENNADTVKVYYSVQENRRVPDHDDENISGSADPNRLISELVQIQSEAYKLVGQSEKSADLLKLDLLGKNSAFAAASMELKNIPKNERPRVGMVINEVKNAILGIIRENNRDPKTDRGNSSGRFFDVTMPGKLPPMGHLHIVTQAINEITEIFSRIGFTRVRYPEIDWDWYAFESLNMPPDHPARDEWETFFINSDKKEAKSDKKNIKFKNMVLTPHTSNAQVREMEKGKLPIRMINIAKCYRRQSDVSHAPMFHQFEGLYVDKDVSIAHLKGVCDYFFKQYFGPDRKSRLRPFHFQFTEPSFEVDVSCGLCGGTGIKPDGDNCRICKEGWLELGGAGMVHPNVLKAGRIDPAVYSGFAFGWGIERCFMMKSGTQIDDLRTIYCNDVRFLEQF